MHALTINGGTDCIYLFTKAKKKREVKKLLVLILYCNLRPYIFYLFLYNTDICGRKINKNEDEQLRNVKKSESTHRQISG